MITPARTPFNTLKKRPLSPSLDLEDNKTAAGDNKKKRETSPSPSLTPLGDEPPDPQSATKEAGDTVLQGEPIHSKTTHAPDIAKDTIERAGDKAQPITMSSDEEEFVFDDSDGGFGDDDEVDFDSTSEPDAFDVMSPVADSPTMKPYDVAYTVKTMPEITAMQTKEVNKIAGLLEIPTGTATILLRHYAWNSERLQEQFWNDPAGALLQAGLSPPSSPSTSTVPLPSPALTSPRRSRATRLGPSSSSTSSAGPSIKRTQSSTKAEPFECPICCSDYPADKTAEMTLDLGCGHRFCRACWTEYLVGKVTGEGESAKIQCMATGCGRIVKAEVLDGLVNGDVSKKYQNLLNQAFVSDSPALRWCPHPACEYIIECPSKPQKMPDQLVPTVTCRCGNDLCFSCGYAGSHRPVLCRIVKHWEKKCADDSETANWLSANTKECTKCNSTIEKNGGCNHMTCRKCKWEFCWVCMGSWSEHGTSYYQCNRFEEKSGVDARDTQAKSRASLERYLHYFNRWANHEQSAKLDVEFYKTTEKKMEQMQASANLSWIEVQFAKQAVDIVTSARITLKWSYCMAFYLAKNNQTELYEDNQRDLERAVENLGYLLEQNFGDVGAIAKLRQDITNQAAYVQKRHDILLDDTLQGYLDRRWEFIV